MDGTGLARAFHADVVGPLLAAQAVAVGRLGTGSDVLGFDDETSRDHDWGCRLTVLADDPGIVAEVDRILGRGLPDTYAGHPVRFALTHDPTVRHRVERPPWRISRAPTSASMQPASSLRSSGSR